MAICETSSAYDGAGLSVYYDQTVYRGLERVKGTVGTSKPLRIGSVEDLRLDQQGHLEFYVRTTLSDKTYPSLYF